MKTTFKVVGAIFGLGLVILIGLHLFLQFGLTKAMREVVLPRVKQETGIDVQLGRLSINMAEGHLYLKDVAVRNPDGFFLENLASVGVVDVEVDLVSLLKQKLILVKNVTVEDALVNVIRNKKGEINVNVLQAGLPTAPSDTPEGEPSAQPGEPTEKAADEAEPLPEILIEALNCKAKARYIDFRLDQLDITLALELAGSNISTLRDPAAEWGELFLTGSLGDDKTSFITDIKLGLAPVADPQSLSFDLTGRVMEIDPRIMDKVYDSLGIRSAPFGFDPELHCRENRFERSSFSLNLNRIRLEDKLARQLGGMASIESLSFPVPVEGTLQAPKVNVQEALIQALGGNTKSLLNAFLKGAAAKEAGLDEPPDSITDAAVEILGKQVEEIGKSEAAKKVLKDLAGGQSSDTNATSQSTSDALIDILGDEVEEIGDNEALKEGLKGLGRKLFGN